MCKIYHIYFFNLINSKNNRTINQNNETGTGTYNAKQRKPTN